MEIFDHERDRPFNRRKFQELVYRLEQVELLPIAEDVGGYRLRCVGVYIARKQSGSKD